MGREYRIILSEIDKMPNKYILVSFKGRDSKIIPNSLNDRDIVDVGNEGFDRLYRKLNGQPEYLFI